MKLEPCAVCEGRGYQDLGLIPGEKVRDCFLCKGAGKVDLSKLTSGGRHFQALAKQQRDEARKQ